MRRFLKLAVFIGSLVHGGGLLLAAEENLILADGDPIKLLFFAPEQSIETPPLALLVSAGSNNKFMARAQFWLGRELVQRGWAIAVPISPGGGRYFEDNPQLFPEIISRLHASHRLKTGKTLLVGISNGGSSALAIAAYAPENYLGVVATPGRIRDQAQFNNLDGLPVYLRIGARDNFRWNKGLGETIEVLHAAGAKVNAAIIPEARHIFRLDWENLQVWLGGLQQPAH